MAVLKREVFKVKRREFTTLSGGLQHMELFVREFCLLSLIYCIGYLFYCIILDFYSKYHKYHSRFTCVKLPFLLCVYITHA